MPIYGKDNQYFIIFVFHIMSNVMDCMSLKCKANTPGHGIYALRYTTYNICSLSMWKPREQYHNALCVSY